MVLCARCQRNISQYECPICKESYCQECDSYVHSFQIRSNHVRSPIINDNITNSPPIHNIQEEKKLNAEINNREFMLNSEEDAKNLNNNNNSPIKNEESPNKYNYIENNDNNTEINKNYKINLSNCNFNQNSNFDKNKNEIEQNLLILKEKDLKIEHLTKLINDQRDKINNLKAQNSQIETKINEDEKIKEDLILDNQKLYTQNKNLKEFYENKIDTLNKMNELQIEKIISDYEKKIGDLKNDFYSSKEMLLDNMNSNTVLQRKKTSEYEEQKKKLMEKIQELKREQNSLDNQQKDEQKKYDSIKQELQELQNELGKYEKLFESNKARRKSINSNIKKNQQKYQQKMDKRRKMGLTTKYE